jgi:hypothetical protein
MITLYDKCLNVKISELLHEKLLERDLLDLKIYKSTKGLIDTTGPLFREKIKIFQRLWFILVLISRFKSTRNTKSTYWLSCRKAATF